MDQDSQDELLDVLRARRGQRLGVDEEGDDELALMLTRDEQPHQAHQRPRLTVATAPAEAGQDTERADGPEGDSAVDSAVDGWVEVWDDDDDEDPRFGTPDDGTTVLDEAGDRDAGEDAGEHPDQTSLELAEESGPPPAPAVKPARQAKAAKSRRPSVPSWDEIVFGRKND